MAKGLLMIPGPLGIRWAERAVPRIEKGEIAGYDLPSRYRVRRWLACAPRVGQDIFIKLFTHGTQERNSSALLPGGLDALFHAVQAECGVRQWPLLLRILLGDVSGDRRHPASRGSSCRAHGRTRIDQIP